MAEWSVETCSPNISSNKSCADMKNWLIVYPSTSWCLYTKKKKSRCQGNIIFGCSDNTHFLVSHALVSKYQPQLDEGQHIVQVFQMFLRSVKSSLGDAVMYKRSAGNLVALKELQFQFKPFKDEAQTA